MLVTITWSHHQLWQSMTQLVLHSHGPYSRPHFDRTRMFAVLVASDTKINHCPVQKDPPCLQRTNQVCQCATLEILYIFYPTFFVNKMFNFNTLGFYYESTYCLIWLSKGEDLPSIVIYCWLTSDAQVLDAAPIWNEYVLYTLIYIRNFAGAYWKLIQSDI